MYQLDMNYELGSCAFVSKQLRKLDPLMLSYKIYLFFGQCRINDLLLPIDIYAYVIFVWEKICWSDNTTNFTIKRRDLYSTLQRD